MAGTRTSAATIPSDPDMPAAWLCQPHQTHPAPHTYIYADQATPQSAPSLPFGNEQQDVGRQHPGALVPFPGEGYLGPLFPARPHRDRQLRRCIRQLAIGVKPLLRGVHSSGALVEKSIHPRTGWQA